MRLIVGLNAAHEGLGDMASLGLVMTDVISTGDPLGLIAVAMTKYFDLQAKDRQKQIDNDTPDKDYGTKMGYVREGDTWYPPSSTSATRARACSPGGRSPSTTGTTSSTEWMVRAGSSP